MGTLSKMRTISPYVLVTIAVMFIAFMVISDMDMPSIMNRGDNAATAVIGKVNGEKILYAEFEKRVREQAENARAQNPTAEELDEAPIREQVWNEMTEEILMRQECKRMGVTVSNDEILDIMLQSPPDFLRKQFSDSAGNFQYQAYLEYVTNPDIITKNGGTPEMAANFKKYLVNLEDAIRREKLAVNMRMALASAVSIMDPAYLERRYQAENASANVDYIALTIDKVDDKQVNVSDDEIANYYNTYKETFKQKPSRKVKYVFLPFLPSQADSAKVQKRFDRLMTALNAAPTPGARDSAFEQFSSEYGGQTNDFKHVQDLAPQDMAVLAALQPREVAGPVQRPQGGSAWYRLDAKRSGENVMVKAAHILVGFGANKDSAKAAAESILAETKAAGANFAELAKKYSQDKGSAQNGGELGFFKKGQMVKPFEDAAFGAEPGSIVGLVETQYGFHILNIKEKKTDEIKYSEIVLNPVMSQPTRAAIYRQAQMLREQTKSGVVFDSVASKMGLIARESPFFRRAAPALGSRAVTNFAFDANIGDVSEPIEMKSVNGMVVVQLTESRVQGVMPLADAKETIRAKLAQAKKLDALKSKAEALAKQFSSLDSLKKAKTLDSTVNLQSAVVKQNGNIQGVGFDMVFACTAFTMPVGKIQGPLRGERAYYIAQVTNRTDADPKAMTPQVRQQLLQTIQNTANQMAFFRWRNEIRDRADIEDFRGKFFRD
jgi:peptidylprolyl isomerase/peptidyl-prolyl cis-trans isomerase D